MRDAPAELSIQPPKSNYSNQRYKYDRPVYHRNTRLAVCYPDFSIFQNGEKKSEIFFRFCFLTIFLFRNFWIFFIFLAFFVAKKIFKVYVPPLFLIFTRIQMEVCSTVAELRCPVSKGIWFDFISFLVFQFPVELELMTMRWTGNEWCHKKVVLQYTSVTTIEVHPPYLFKLSSSTSPPVACRAFA